jgi:hypothetical protein
MSSGGHSTPYKPSPYSSILPRVQLSKTKPLVQVVDVPPATANHNGTHEVVVDAKRDIEIDVVDKSKGSTGPLVDRSDHVVESADQKCQATKYVKVINTISTHQKEDANAKSSTQICSTCMKHIARYTCPKCSALYCSVDCYKIHDGTNVCTESFYKNRVLGEYHACGDNEDRRKLQGILNRLHNDINMQMDDVEGREHSLSQLLHENRTPDLNGDVKSGLMEYHQVLTAATLEGDTADQISDEELAELASYILNLQDEDEIDSDPDARVQKMKETLPPHLLDAFDYALASALELECEKSQDDGLNLKDERNKQMAIAKWQPWWLPETMDEGTNDVVTLSPNLDERILSIQPFPSLTSQTNNRNLAFNILDVVFSTSFALRSSVSNVAAAEKAAELLLSQSLVLLDNANYESVHEALSSCAEHFVESNKTMNIKNLTWDMLASDVGLVSCNRRYVLRILFEAADLLESGVELIREHTKTLKKTDKNALGANKKELDEIKRLYKRTLKKVEYFESWCSTMWGVDLAREISDEVGSFIEHWKLPEVQEHESHIESMLGNMLNKGVSSAMNSDTSTIGLIEIGRKDHPYRMGKELVAVSSAAKKESSTHM